MEGGGFCNLLFLPSSVNEQLGHLVPIRAPAFGGWEKKGEGRKIFYFKIISLLSHCEKRDGSNRSEGFNSLLLLGTACRQREPYPPPTPTPKFLVISSVSLFPGGLFSWTPGTAGARWVWAAATSLSGLSPGSQSCSKMLIAQLHGKGFHTDSRVSNISAIPLPGAVVHSSVSESQEVMVKQGCRGGFCLKIATRA